MAKNSIKKMKIKAFSITNDIEIDKLINPITYNNELMDKFLKAIMMIDLDKRKFKNEEVTLNLIEYKQSDNINIMRGVFTTARHGVKQITINIETQEEMQEIKPYEGVKNEIHFSLDKQTGLLLVEEDKLNHVFSRSIFKSFLYQHRHIIYPYIEKFNVKNRDKKASIYKRNFYSVTSLPPTNFFDKINEFKSIKSGILYVNTSEQHNKQKKHLEVVAALENELEENGIKKFDLELKIKNKSPLGMVKTFEKYFKRMIEIQKYDNVAIEGVTETGTTKKITPDSITREFEIRVEYNINGLPKLDDITRGMEDIINNKNPLREKRILLEEGYLLKDDDDVLQQIKEITMEINKSRKGNQKTTEEKEAR